MISPVIAWRLRTRGLILPTDGAVYETLRLQEIAHRQKELLDEHEKLDREIQDMARSSYEKAGMKSPI